MTGKVRVPPLWAFPSDPPPPTGAGYVGPEVSQERDPHSSDPRVLISVFLTDQPGILRSVVGAVRDGVRLAELEGRAEHPDGLVHLTIDGLLASSLDGIFVVALIVRPLDQDGETAQIDRDGLGEALAESISERTEGFREVLADDGADLRDDRSVASVRPGVSCRGLSPHGKEIFAGRVFSEYRLSLSGGRLEGAKTLGTVAKEASRILANAEIPIAYMFFPDRWTSAPEEQILRVGLGAPPGVVDLVETDIQLSALAHRSRCELGKYDPRRVGASLTDRFYEIVGSGQPVPSTEEGQAYGKFDAVLVEGSARPGLVAEVLGHTGELMGGTMTVLRGHSIACWMVPHGTGETVRRELEGHFEEEVRDGRIHVDVRTSATRTYPRAGGRSLWIAWNGPDRPGVVSDLLSELRDHIQDTWKGDPGQVDVKYAVSRVLAQGDSCAGKLNLMISEDLLTVLGDEVDARFRRLEAALSARCPDHSPIVRDAEPGEEPWASLVVDSNI